MSFLLIVSPLGCVWQSICETDRFEFYKFWNASFNNILSLFCDKLIIIADPICNGMRNLKKNIAKPFKFEFSNFQWHKII